MLNWILPSQFSLRRLLPLVLFSLLCLFTACTQSNQEAHDVFGKSIDLNQNHSKWLVINYWAQWCPPCLTEFDVFNTLSKQYATQVIVVGINFDEISAAQQRQIALKYAIRYPLLRHNINKRLQLPDTSVLPTTYLIAPNGRLAKILTGPQTLTHLKTLMSLK